MRKISHITISGKKYTLYQFDDIIAENSNKRVKNLKTLTLVKPKIIEDISYYDEYNYYNLNQPVHPNVISYSGMSKFYKHEIFYSLCVGEYYDILRCANNKAKYQILLSLLSNFTIRNSYWPTNSIPKKRCQICGRAFELNQFCCYAFYLNGCITYINQLDPNRKTKVVDYKYNYFWIEYDD